MRKNRNKKFIEKNTKIIKEKLLELLKKAERKAVKSIDFIDDSSEKILAFFSKVSEKLVSEWSFLSSYTHKNTKEFMAITVFAFIIAFTGLSLLHNHTVYIYKYDGQALGMARDQSKVIQSAELASLELSKEYDVNVSINKDKDIEFEKRIVPFQDTEKVDGKKEIFENFVHLSDTKVNASAIIIDGQQVCVVKNEKAAKALLKKVRKEALGDKKEEAFKEVSYAEDVEIIELETKLSEIQDEDKALDIIMTGGQKTEIHEVVVGDSMHKIATDNDIEVKDLMEMNPDVDPAELYVSQEIKLEKETPLITVLTTEIRKYKEEIPYAIIYEDTDKTYEGQEFVKKKGKPGEKEVIAEVVSSNGRELSRQIMYSEILKESKSAKVLRGTRSISEPMGKGYFKMPTDGRFSSMYGPRWGRKHNGVDIAAPTGTPIYAAAGGTVIESTNKKSYGNMVVISHGGSRTTLYAHCSELLVKPGDRVLQGDIIAKVGSTGNSTGPHCHFEVQIDGVPKNPMKYL